MSDLTGELISEVASSALESMAFMLPDEASATETAAACIHARITYEGEKERSELFLSATEGFVTELASAMLGLEPEDIDPLEEGVLGLSELANVLAGEVIRLLGAETHPFDVGIPAAIPSLPQSAGSGTEIEAHLESMGEFLRVRVIREMKEEN